MIDLDYAYGKCHALSAAILAIAPAAEAFGLFVDGTCIHSAVRVPHTTAFVDAFGLEEGEGALATKAARYLRADETFTWKPISETDLFAMVPGVGSADRARNIRAARKHAVALLN